MGVDRKKRMPSSKVKKVRWDVVGTGISMWRIVACDRQGK